MSDVIHECIEYAGDKYYKRTNGYYYTSPTRGSKRLHIQMYQVHWNCIIPKGFVVHHKDEDKENNTVDNYFLLTRAGHQRWHSKHMSDETKEKIRIARLGKKHSEETKAKLRIASIGKHYGLGKKHPHTGKFGSFTIEL